MARVLLDISGEKTVTSSSQTDAASFTVPAETILVLTQYNLVVGSGFVTNGRVSVKLGSDILTSGGANVSEVKLTGQELNFDFEGVKKGAAVKALRSGETIVTRARLASGSSETLNVTITGQIFTEEQFERLRQKQELELV